MPMRWLLPEYFEDILPEEAARIEALRRALLDLFASRGYELVMPPLLEYVESLLTGTGHDLDLRTFKLVDQLSGRMMGVRADITPQVARIDAHLLNEAGFAVVPFHAFGTDDKNGWFRLSVGAIGVDEIAPAIDRVRAALTF